MPKIAFIGAGSFTFTRTLVKDLLTFKRLQNATIALMDVDSERLTYSTQAVQRIVREGSYPATVVATQDRREALDGADAVLCTILCGDWRIWRYDIEIPKRYGVNICVGDTRGPAGIFRALRTIPTMLDICQDMAELCPRAILLNYTNPMAMLCRAMQIRADVQVSGLCHSVQQTAYMLADWIGAPFGDIDTLCAGINHQAFFLRYNWNGRDAYPLIRDAIKNKDIYNREQVRNEMFRALDYYVTESSGHSSEYNWWFRKRPDLIDKYCTHGTGWNPGQYGAVLKGYRQQSQRWRKEIRDWLETPDPLDLRRGYEYAAAIINAYLGGDPFEFNGNVPNSGLIPNLPPDACVEVPVIANSHGFNPVHVGPLPPQLAALNTISIAVEEMAVQAALTGNPKLVYQAICYDPLTAAVLSLQEIRKMVKAMFRKNETHLTQFSTLDF